MGLRSLVRLCKLQLTHVCLRSVTGTRQRDSDAGDESTTQLRYFRVPSGNGGASSSDDNNSSCGSSNVAGAPGGPSSNSLGTDAGVTAGSSADWLGSIAYGAVARLRLLALQGMVGVTGGPWRRRAASRDRLD